MREECMWTTVTDTALYVVTLLFDLRMLLTVPASYSISLPSSGAFSHPFLQCHGGVVPASVLQLLPSHDEHLATILKGLLDGVGCCPQLKGVPAVKNQLLLSAIIIKQYHCLAGSCKAHNMQPAQVRAQSLYTHEGIEAVAFGKHT